MTVFPALVFLTLLSLLVPLSYVSLRSSGGNSPDAVLLSTSPSIVGGIYGAHGDDSEKHRVNTHTFTPDADSEIVTDGEPETAADSETDEESEPGEESELDSPSQRNVAEIGAEYFERLGRDGATAKEKRKRKLVEELQDDPKLMLKTLLKAAKVVDPNGRKGATILKFKRSEKILHCDRTS
jgi:hypothetical protein